MLGTGLAKFMIFDKISRYSVHNLIFEFHHKKTVFARPIR
jgi:hypothetical protein